MGDQHHRCSQMPEDRRHVMQFIGILICRVTSIQVLILIVIMRVFPAIAVDVMRVARHHLRSWDLLGAMHQGKVGTLNHFERGWSCRCHRR